MKNDNLAKTILIISIIIFSSFQSLSAGPAETLTEYIKAIRDSDLAKAESYWLTSEIDNSKRLGITFTGIDAKYDCASPLVYGYGFQRANPKGDRIDITYIDSVTAKAEVYFSRDGSVPLPTPYYLIKENDKWLLCSPTYVHTRDWVEKSTRYFNVYSTDSSLINDYALNMLDNLADSLGRRLNIAANRMEYLAQTKIDYFLCDEKQIELLTGHTANGMTNFQFDAIITRHLPHTHELVHLLYNFTQEDLPLFTIPVLQEGLACCLGGRWGKSPEVISYWGNVSLTLELAGLDDILTTEGFHRCPGGIDAAYAISSLFVETLIDKFGISQLKKYYLELSGSNQVINQFSGDDIKTKAEAIFRMSWAEIAESLIATTEKYKYCGIVPGHPPALKDTHKQFESENIKVVIWEFADVYNFQINLSPECPGGAIVLTDEAISSDSWYQSRFFNEQFPDKRYIGEIYGLRFSPGEVGLYNYHTNILLGKYVLGFTPDENYWDAENRIVTFSLDKALLDKDIGGYQIGLLEDK